MQDENHNNANSRKPQIPVHIQTIVQPGKKYDCVICKKDISSYAFIYVQGQTTQKTMSNGNYQNNSNGINNNGLCYCIPCFAKMKKWATSYRVINKLQFPILEDHWSALEEIYMMEGLEKHGFGNWNQIADYIQTNKTKQDVQKHYTEFYLTSANFLPVQMRLLQDQSRINLSRHTSNNSKAIKNKNKINRQTSNSKRMKTINMEKSNLKVAGVEIVGYMPLRNDYEFQYDNQAELLLAQMEFNQEDTEEQRQLKFRIIQLYNQRLTQRNRKKDFVLSRGILNLEKQIQQEKTLPKSQKQIYNMMKIFSRFSISSDHEELVKGIVREKQLRQKIQQYKELHRRGFKTKAEVQQQLQRKKNETKTKKKNTHEYNFLDSSRNRRANHSQSQLTVKKPSIYFQTQEQVELLKNLKLSSISYMMIKQTILREFAKLGTIDRESTINMFSVQRFIVNSVLDFLQANHQISCSN